MYRRKTGRPFKFQGPPSAGVRTLLHVGDSVSTNSLFHSHIKTRKCSEKERVPSLDSEDHPLMFQWKGRPWRRMKQY